MPSRRAGTTFPPSIESRHSQLRLTHATRQPGATPFFPPRSRHRRKSHDAVGLLLLDVITGTGKVVMLPLNELGRYPLSIILSFLCETEGTSFLITRKQYAYQLLPVFRLRPFDCEKDEVKFVASGGNDVAISAPSDPPKRKHRHKFVVVKVQDPVVMLARLNTRRLFQRRQPVHPRGRSTSDLARLEWRRHRQEEHFSPALFRPCSLQLLRFLDRSSPFNAQGVTLLVSYPRSGNSLARSLLERATGIVTGSDTRPDFELSVELSLRHGMVGEGVTASTHVAFLKSHWPERAGMRPVPDCRRAVLLARNPYDAIDSYWNMCATKSHTRTVSSEVYDRFRDKHRQLVRNEIFVWLKFHHYWLKAAASIIPVLLVRYEDLVRNPREELARILQFALRVEELDSYWMARVEHATSSGGKRMRRTDLLGSYRPRTSHAGTIGGDGSGAEFGKALKRRHMTDDLVRYIHDTSARFECNYLQELGYDDMFPDRLSPASGKEAKYGSRIYTGQSSGASVLTINDGCTIRPSSCPFGRGMRAWRRSVTDNDRSPLPTTPD